MDTPTIDPYHFSRSIRGVPSPGNRTHRASVSCWERGMTGKTVGVATDSDMRPLVDYASVKVIKGDTTTIVPASHFRKESVHTKQRNHRVSEAAIDHQNKMDELRHVSAGELAPIGNVE